MHSALVKTRACPVFEVFCLSGILTGCKNLLRGDPIGMGEDEEQFSIEDNGERFAEVGVVCVVDGVEDNGKHFAEVRVV